MKILYDITIPVTEQIAVWPGDEPYQFDLGWKMSEGASVNVGAVTLSVHTGTHTDAPFHFDDQGTGIGEMDLAPYLGPAAVIDATGHEEIGPDIFAGVDFVRTPRVLIRTGGWTDHTVFPETIPLLTSQAVAFLAAQGALLIGLDVPSVDAIESKTLPIHHALTAANIRILESLDLADVPPGEYGLIALPLRLMGTDGSPVRAVLTAFSAVE